MKKYFLLVLLIIQNFCIEGQVKILSRNPQRVPAGKKWVLTNSMTPIATLDNSVFATGTACNASIKGAIKILSFIAEGNYPQVNQAYSIAFKGLSKIAFSNDRTYELSNIQGFRGRDSPDKSPLNNALVFYPDQVVFLYGCLENIQVIESDLTIRDMQQKKISEDLKAKKIEQKEENEKKIEQKEENELANRIVKGGYFKYPELNNRPQVQILDSTRFSELLFNCIYKAVEGKRGGWTGRIGGHLPFFVFDTTMTLKDIEYASVNKSTLCIDEFAKILKIDRVARVYYHGKEVKVNCMMPFEINYSIEPIENSYGVYIKRGQIEKRTLNKFKPNDSLVLFIKDYILKHPLKDGLYSFESRGDISEISGRFYTYNADESKEIFREFPFYKTKQSVYLYKDEGNGWKGIYVGSYYGDKPKKNN